MKLTTLAVLVIGCCSPLILAAQQTQGTLTNGRIEDMVLAGVSQSEIIRIISTASAFNFDLSPGSTDNLLKLGVSEDIIKAMAARENGTAALERPIADGKKVPADTAVTTGRDIPQSEASTNKGILTNQHIGGMVIAGVSQSEIIRIISTTSAFNFDLRPGSTDNLLKVGVSENIIKAMAAREIGAPIQAAVLSVQPVLVSPKPVEPPPVTTAVSTTAAVISRRVVTSSGVLHQGAPVRMRIMRTVSSADAQVGNNVDFQTLDDIKQNGVILIPKGSTAIATITVAEAKKREARGGKLGMNIDYLRLPNGDELPLRGVQNLKGGGHTGLMTGAIVASAIVFWPAAPFFLFMHGKDVVIPEGHEVTVYTNTDYTF